MSLGTFHSQGPLGVCGHCAQQLWPEKRSQTCAWVRTRFNPCPVNYRLIKQPVALPSLMLLCAWEALNLNCTPLPTPSAFSVRILKAVVFQL